MICAYCGNEYSAVQLGGACRACGKIPSRPRLFLEAERGDAEAQLLCAEHCLAEDGDATLAVAEYYLYASCSAGCRAAALAYASRLLDGSFGDRDPAGAKAVLAPHVRHSFSAALLSARAGVLLRPKAPDAPTKPPIFDLAIRLASDAETALDYRTATEILAHLSDGGDGRATELLGALYEEGRMLRRDPAVAKQLYLAAWEQGSVSALVRLGDLLSDGMPCESPERATALECYRSAEEAGNIEASIRLGDAYVDGIGCAPSVRRALEHYRRAEEQSPYARERIAEILAVLDESYRRALSLLERGEESRARRMLTDLVESGHAEAANRLGYLLQPTDRRAAARLYALAAELGSRVAHYNLAVCYAEGIGVAFSYRLAVRHLETAKQAGVSAAEGLLRTLRGRRRRAELRKLYALACLLYRRGDFFASSRLLHAAAEAGDPASMHRLCCHLRRGDGVAKNETEAAEWEARARAAGFRDARRCEIGYLRIRREHELAGKLKP